MKYIVTDERPMSWSSLSSFKYNKNQWYDSYILGIKQDSPELRFGSMVDKRLQDDPEYLPHVPRYPLMQHRMLAHIGDLPIVGIPDGTDILSILADYKTGKKAWDQKRADETGQLTFYALLIYLTEKLRPEDFKFIIHWLPTKWSDKFKIEFRNPEQPECIDFYTRRSMVDILKFGKEIQDTYKEMQEFVEAHN